MHTCNSTGFLWGGAQPSSAPQPHVRSFPVVPRCALVQQLWFDLGILAAGANRQTTQLLNPPESLVAAGVTDGSSGVPDGGRVGVD